jgi:ABC-type transport system involved in multi-copper enzyme maturation permease subunit
VTWFAWRQFRLQSFVVLGLLVAMAVFFAITGPHLWSLYDGLKTCKERGDCASLTNSVNNGYSTVFPFFLALSIALPGLLGIFWGAPLIARELESGTYRLAWTQGVTRARWVVTKLLVVGAASMVAAGLMSWMFMWWASPYNTLSADRFSSSVFDAAYIAPIGYAAFALALGVAAGVLWRRTVPAMATTLVAFVAVRIPFAHFIRPRLMTPLTKVTTFKHAQNIGFERTPTGMSFVVGDANQPNALLVSNSIVGNHGGALTSNWLKTNCHALFNFEPNPAKNGPTSTGIKPSAFSDCMNKISASFHQVLSYQPASRFWTFQWIEMSIYIALALLLGAFSYWWVKHRMA